MAEEYEKRTPVFNWNTGEFVRDPQGFIATVTEDAAMEQVAIKALSTVRGVYLIYADVDNEELNHKYGSDVDNIRRQPLSDEIRLEEFKRAVVEALIYDPWVNDVTDVSIARSEDQSDAVNIDFTLRTIFDKDLILEGVNIFNG